MKHSATSSGQKKPLYQEIINDIMTALNSGKFSYDQPLCTENSLMEKYGYSRITIRRALDELEKQGILYRKRGVGSFVSRELYSEETFPVPSNSGKLFPFIFPFCISRTGLTTAFQAASDYLLAKGCYASIYISESEGKNQGRTILDRLLDMNVAGIAYYPQTSNIHIEQLNCFLFSGKPVVVMDIPSGSPYIPSVTSDNLAGSMMLMKHLLELGHRKIAYLSGVSPAARLTISDRLAGYVLALSEAKVPIAPQFIYTDISEDARSAPLSSPGSLRAILRTLLHMGVTAVAAEHDGIAYDILLCCRDLGIDVPGQLSVCGFDNSEWATALSNSTPPLCITTIAQDQSQIGRKVAELLWEGLNQPIRQQNPIVVPVSFIPGNTTGKAPSES